MTFSPVPLPSSREQKQHFNQSRGFVLFWGEEKKNGRQSAIFCCRAERLADSQGWRHPACFSVRTKWMFTPKCLMACDRKLPHYHKYSAVHWTSAWHNVSQLTGTPVWLQQLLHHRIIIFLRRHGSNYSYFPASILCTFLFIFSQNKNKTTNTLKFKDFLAVRCDPGADVFGVWDKNRPDPLAFLPIFCLSQTNLCIKTLREMQMLCDHS